MQHRNIAFIGAGNMSRSIISGMCNSGYPVDKIIASNPSMPKLDALKKDFSIQITQQNKQAVEQAQVIVLAVKPQLMETMCAALKDSVALDRFVCANECQSTKPTIRWRFNVSSR